MLLIIYQQKTSKIKKINKRKRRVKEYRQIDLRLFKRYRIYKLKKSIYIVSNYDDNKFLNNSINLEKIKKLLIIIIIIYNEAFFNINNTLLILYTIIDIRKNFSFKVKDKGEDRKLDIFLFNLYLLSN